VVYKGRVKPDGRSPANAVGLGRRSSDFPNSGDQITRDRPCICTKYPLYVLSEKMARLWAVALKSLVGPTSCRRNHVFTAILAPDPASSWQISSILVAEILDSMSIRRPNPGSRRGRPRVPHGGKILRLCNRILITEITARRSASRIRTDIGLPPTFSQSLVIRLCSGRCRSREDALLIYLHYQDQSCMTRN
jgi:hypothetical protein